LRIKNRKQWKAVNDQTREGRRKSLPQRLAHV
jgi:hypothetical protein